MAIRCTYIICHSSTVNRPLFYFIAVRGLCRKGYGFVLFDAYRAFIRFRYAVSLCFKRTACAVHAKAYDVRGCRRSFCSYPYRTACHFIAVFGLYRDNRFSRFVRRYLAVFVYRCNIRFVRTPRYRFVCCLFRLNRCFQRYRFLFNKRYRSRIQCYARYRYWRAYIPFTTQ